MTRPYLKPLLTTSNGFDRALSTLSLIPGPETTALLLGYAASTNRETAARARSLLESSPRVEAEDSYFKWLEEDAGRAPVLELLAACAKVNRLRLAPLLPRVLAAPRSMPELRRAFELSRSLSGRGLPPELLKAEESIRVHGYRSATKYGTREVRAAAAELLRAKDTEAAACLGLSLALATAKGDLGPANEAGLEVLKALPAGQGRQMVKALYNSCDDPYVRERLTPVVKQ